jgi:small subunit ribosomal protein S18
MSSEIPSQSEGPASEGPRPAPAGAPLGAPRGPRPAYADRRPSYGDRGGDRGDRGDRGGPGGARRPRRRVCAFCVEKVQKIDYKDVGRIRRYISERGKIDPRRKSGTCAKHQRMLTSALKRARFMALLPYTADHVRSLMSPQARAMAGGPPPPKPDRPPYRPSGDFRPAPRYGPPPVPGVAAQGAAAISSAPVGAPTAAAPASSAPAPAPRRPEGDGPAT